MAKFVLAACILLCAVPYGFAQTDTKPAIDHSERLFLAHEFLERMKNGFSVAEKVLKPPQILNVEDNILPEGEELFFQAFLPKRLKLDGVMLGRFEQNQIQISLKDFLYILELPINIDEEAQTAKGWYIRENKNFILSLKDQTIRTDQGSFEISENVSLKNNDIWVPLDELGKWFDFKLKPIISSLELHIEPSQPLPVQERFQRKKRKESKRKIKEPELPRGDEDYQLIGIPFVDVLTNSRYEKNGETEERTKRHNISIRTAGDFAYGTLITQTQLNNEDNITNVRATYKQESLEPDLLGPLKAKRFEIGDVVPTRLPLGGNINQELGTRITNVDPLRSFTNPTTAISGTTFPGWDVELYRDNQLVGLQTVNDDGFYSFNNVDLFQRDNNFRVVFYGPQGEIREEEIFVPVDSGRLSETGSIYDVSLTFDRKQTYKNNTGFEDRDEGTANISALYEIPVMDGTAVSAGFRSNEQDGERNNVLHGGLSTTLFQTLINANAAIDDEAEAAAELVARRDFGPHEVINTMRWFAEDFDSNSGGAQNTGSFRENFNAIGPLPFDIGNKSRYSVNLNYTLNSDGDSTLSSTTGFNTAWKNFTFNEQLQYLSGNNLQNDRITNLASLTGVYGGNRLRLRSDYEIKPDNKLSRIVANFSRNFSNETELDLELERRIDPNLTEATAQLNWQAGFARISPSISYNSDNDLFAGLSTRFGLAHEPQNTDLRAFDRPVTSNGGLSALVFLDENGDGILNPEEQPLEDVTVRALQNGGREVTDKNGIAFFTRLRELKLTDVFVDEETLKDPFWISTFEGISVLPREGYVAQVQFPIHIAGELDGTVYAGMTSETSKPLKNIILHLYNDQGSIEQSATTDIGGFYLFTKIPPGRYLLLIDEKSTGIQNYARPKPQPIEIGYDGTFLYGNNIHLDSDSQDIPSLIKANLQDYKSRHPHIDFDSQGYQFILNLGEYKSRLLMSLVWYETQSRYRQVLGNAELIVSPAQSLPDDKTGAHTLRAGLQDTDIDSVYERCRTLLALDLYCKVEIFPAVTAQKISNNTL